MAGDMKMLFLAACCQAGVVLAAADPTQPPAGFTAESAGAEVVDTGPRLQSVVLPRQGKPTAVISGQTVRLGERYGDSRLVRISENEVVLDGPQGVQRLSLTPEVSKVNVREQRGKAPAGRKKDAP